VPKDASLYEFNPNVMNQSRQATLARMAGRLGEATARRYYALREFKQSGSVLVTNPLLVLAVTETEILSALEKFSWQRPTDTGRHSSNCRLNDLGIKVHLQQFGFHPYTAELAEQVRQGLMSREEARERLQALPDEAKLEGLATELGVAVDRT
jgi:hypothetical protein